jgi:hypothetical protein
MHQAMRISTFNPCRRARPLPGPSDFSQPCSNWIQLDITQRFREVRLIEWARKESILPKMSCPPLLDVKPSGVVVVRPAQTAFERIDMFWNYNEVNMVGHQAITEDPQVCVARVIPKQIQVHLPVGIAKEHLLLQIPALRNVMRPAGQYDSRLSPHLVWEVAGAGTGSQKLVIS